MEMNDHINWVLGRETTREKVRKSMLSLRSNTKKATVGEYNRWLKGYLEKGSKNNITNRYDYEFERKGNMYMVIGDGAFIDDLYGSSSIDLIIPKGKKIDIRDIGHCNIYYMDGYRLRGHSVPIYNNVILEDTIQEQLSELKRRVDNLDEIIKKP